MAAMAVFESSFKEHMTVSSIFFEAPFEWAFRLDSSLTTSDVTISQRQEAIDLVARAIRSGVFNDLGSGSNVDVCVIKKDKTEMLRNYEMPVSALSSSFPCILYRPKLTDLALRFASRRTKEARSPVSTSLGEERRPGQRKT